MASPRPLVGMKMLLHIRQPESPSEANDLKQRAKRLVRRLGAMVTLDAMDADVVIFYRGSDALVQNMAAHGKAVVTIQWLAACSDANERVPFGPFLVAPGIPLGASTSSATPLRGGAAAAEASTPLLVNGSAGKARRSGSATVAVAVSPADRAAAAALRTLRHGSSQELTQQQQQQSVPKTSAVVRGALPSRRDDRGAAVYGGSFDEDDESESQHRPFLVDDDDGGDAVGGASDATQRVVGGAFGAPPAATPAPQPLAAAPLTQQLLPDETQRVQTLASFSGNDDETPTASLGTAAPAAASQHMVMTQPLAAREPKRRHRERDGAKKKPRDDAEDGSHQDLTPVVPSTPIAAAAVASGRKRDRPGEEAAAPAPPPPPPTPPPPPPARRYDPMVPAPKRIALTGPSEMKATLREIIPQLGGGGRDAAVVTTHVFGRCEKPQVLVAADGADVTVTVLLARVLQLPILTVKWVFDSLDAGFFIAPEADAQHVYTGFAQELPPQLREAVDAAPGGLAAALAGGFPDEDDDDEDGEAVAAAGEADDTVAEGGAERSPAANLAAAAAARRRALARVQTTLNEHRRPPNAHVLANGTFYLLGVAESPSNAHFRELIELLGGHVVLALTAAADLAAIVELDGGKQLRDMLRREKLRQEKKKKSGGGANATTPVAVEASAEMRALRSAPIVQSRWVLDTALWCMRLPFEPYLVAFDDEASGEDGDAGGATAQPGAAAAGSPLRAAVAGDVSLTQAGGAPAGTYTPVKQPLPKPVTPPSATVAPTTAAVAGPAASKPAESAGGVMRVTPTQRRAGVLALHAKTQPGPSVAVKFALNQLSTQQLNPDDELSASNDDDDDDES